MSIGEDGFLWFIGIVEDTEDPLKLGRVKARILHDHDREVTTDELHWAGVMTPTTSAAVQGAGDSPSLAVGSMVIGFYIDGAKKQSPMVIGSFAVIPNNNELLHGLSSLARGVGAITKELIGPEPASAYKAEYPYNRTITTKSGHAIELDDTPGNERIHIYHKTGTYIEINSEGQYVCKTPSHNYEIVGGNKILYVVGDCAVEAEGTISLKSHKSFAISAPGGAVVTEGSILVEGALGTKQGATGSFSTPTGQTVHVQSGIITNIY
jgi:hypothetical protein